MCVQLINRSFICPSFSFFLICSSIIHSKVYFIWSEHCHILPSSCHDMKKHAPCIAQNCLDPSWCKWYLSSYLLFVFICRCTKKCHLVSQLSYQTAKVGSLPDTEQSTDLSGWGEGHPVMTGVMEYLDCSPFSVSSLSSCLLITQVSFSSCMTYPSNPGSGSTQSVVTSYLKERKGRFILKGKDEVFFSIRN